MSAGEAGFANIDEAADAVRALSASPSASRLRVRVSQRTFGVAKTADGIGTGIPHSTLGPDSGPRRRHVGENGVGRDLDFCPATLLVSGARSEVVDISRRDATAVQLIPHAQWVNVPGCRSTWSLVIKTTFSTPKSTRSSGGYQKTMEVRSRDDDRHRTSANLGGPTRNPHRGDRSHACNAARRNPRPPSTYRLRQPGDPLPPLFQWLYFLPGLPAVTD